MGLGGIPRRKLTDRENEQLRYFSGIRLPLEHIAATFGMDKESLSDIIKKDDPSRSAVMEGRASASGKVRGTLYQRAVGVQNKNGEWEVHPDLAALKFWCQTQEGFKMEDRLELTGAGGGPITVAALNTEERKAIIERYLLALKETDGEE